MNTKYTSVNLVSRALALPHNALLPQKSAGCPKSHLPFRFGFSPGNDSPFSFISLKVWMDIWSLAIFRSASAIASSQRLCGLAFLCKLGLDMDLTFCVNSFLWRGGYPMSEDDYRKTLEKARDELLSLL